MSEPGDGGAVSAWIVNGAVEELPPDERPAYDPACYLCPGNERAGGVRCWQAERQSDEQKEEQGQAQAHVGSNLNCRVYKYTKMSGLHSP